MSPSVHVLGSSRFEGSEQFYIQLVRALHVAGKAVLAVYPSGSPTAKLLEQEGMEQLALPFGSLDTWATWRVHRVVSCLQPCIVQTYLHRATGLLRFKSDSSVIHIARIGGFYPIDEYKHAHVWVASTKTICDHLVRSGLPAASVYQIGTLIPNIRVSSPAERVILREQYGFEPSAFILLTHGRIARDNGFPDLLQAFAQLPPELNGRPLHLLVGGKGPGEKALRELTTRLQLWDRVHWLESTDVTEYFLFSDLFVSPFTDDRTGNMILNAWSYGLPVVSVANEGASELIEDERNGLLAEPNHALSLAMRLDAAITASRLARRGLVEAGLAVIRQRFSQKAVTEAYLNLYDMLLAERGV